MLSSIERRGSPWNDANVVGVFLHRERLSGAGLAVGEDRRVVAVEDALQNPWRYHVSTWHDRIGNEGTFFRS